MDTLVARMPSQPTPKVWQPWVTRDDTAGKISFRHTPAKYLTFQNEYDLCLDA